MDTITSGANPYIDVAGEFATMVFWCQVQRSGTNAMPASAMLYTICLEA